MTEARFEGRVAVRSSAVDLGDVLPERVRVGVRRVASKYSGEPSDATVYFGREGQQFRCTVNVQVGSLPIQTGEALHSDAYRSFEMALDKVAKQLRRRKRALRDDKSVRPRSAAAIRAGGGAGSD